MNLAYFSPLNPQPSGISDYSEELLPYLASHAQVTLFVDGFEPSNPEIRRQFIHHDYRRDQRVLQTLGDYDAVVYHLGNDHRYHAGILEVSRQHPGVVVFHDFVLQDFFLGLARARNRSEIYLEELLVCHGEAATRAAAEALERGSLPALLNRPTDFPLNCRIAGDAAGIIVHSEWARSRIAAVAPGVPVTHIPMPIKSSLVSRKSAHTKKPADAVGPNSDAVQIANFGLITPGKGIENALRVLSTLKADHNFHYTLVGEPNSFFDVSALVRKYGMEDRVTVTGHLPLDAFERHIAATDIALNLRERTVGETSASLCRIMAAGVAAIVFNVGAFSELPNDAVVKIDHDENADAFLEAYLRRLIEDKDLREQLGRNAQDYIRTEHNIEHGAANYLKFIGEVIAQRPRRKFVRSVADEISVLRVNDEAMLRQVAEDVAILAPVAGITTVAEKNGSRQTPSARVPKPVKAVTDNGSSTKTSQSVASDSGGRLPPIEGINYKRAALEYPRRLDEERSYYLRTKPFYNLVHKPDKHTGDGMDAETHRHFTDFANMARVLALPAGARVLDVGCGSGWLSEYFARLGYEVTGVDISDDLIEMARERVARVPYNVDHETPLRCRFLTHDIEAGPLMEKFDAVICYDALHHFEDERKVFRHLAAMLDVGGLLFILEGHKPEAGSATEEELQDVMRRYGTLESPFSGDYLRALLDDNGLAVTGDYLSVNGLFERELIEDDRLQVGSLATDYHYLTSIKVADEAAAATVPDSLNPGVLRARYSLRQTLPSQMPPGMKLNIPITIKNTGDTLWLTGQTVRAGVVMPAVRLIDEAGEIIREFHGYPMLARPVAPGQTVAMDVYCQAPFEPGKYTIKIDLVDQHVCWFEERGSQPLLVSIEVENPVSKQSNDA